MHSVSGRRVFREEGYHFLYTLYPQVCPRDTAC